MDGQDSKPHGYILGYETRISAQCYTQAYRYPPSCRHTHCTQPPGPFRYFTTNDHPLWLLLTLKVPLDPCSLPIPSPLSFRMSVLCFQNEEASSTLVNPVLQATLPCIFILFSLQMLLCDKTCPVSIADWAVMALSFPSRLWAYSSS